MKMSKVVTLSILLILLLALSFGAGLASCAVSTPAPPPAEPDFDLISEAWQILFNDYVNKDALDPKELTRGAIRGLIESVGDPYTSYVTPEHYKLELSELEGGFDGIGAMVGLENGRLVITAPIAGSPAAEAGIEAGDQILEIDGESTAKMTLLEAVLKIRGERGTKVKLRVLHESEDAPEEIEITRAEIKTDSVYLEMLPGDIAHIKITYFSLRTGSELSSILSQLQGEDVAGIVLDLRDDPGGVLDAAIAVASQFLKEGVVLYAKDSEGRQHPIWEVIPGGLATDVPLVVLVNSNSASASEVVAGALQDQGRAMLIGTRTVGKGSLNLFRQLSDGSAIYVTIARWYTPNGHLIEGEGLAPDIEVERTEEDIGKGADPQLERAIDYLRSQRAIPGKV